jgi:N-acylneuraminate cytidylyltransferase
VVHLRATGPVRRPVVLDEAIRTMLGRPDATALRSVNVPEHTPYKMWRIEDGFLRPLLYLEGFPEAHSMPRQKLPPVYWHNPYVDVIVPSVILEKGSMCGDRVIPFIIPEDVIDIDSPEALPRAEAALRRLRQDRRETT